MKLLRISVFLSLCFTYVLAVERYLNLTDPITSTNLDNSNNKINPISQSSNCECKSSDLNVARQFLRDNGIDAVPTEDSPLQQLIDEMPFNEKPKVILKN